MIYNQIIESRILKGQSGEEGAQDKAKDEQGDPGEQAVHCKGKVNGEGAQNNGRNSQFHKSRVFIGQSDYQKKKSQKVRAVS